MEKERKLLWIEFGFLLANVALALFQAYVAPDSGNTYIRNSNVVINNRYQEEESPSALMEPAYEIATLGRQNAIMRSCAHQECASIGVLPDGSVIHVSGFVRGESIGGNNIWFQVEYNSRTGFVFGKLVRDINRIG